MMCSVLHTKMKIDIDKLPEEMKCDIKETLLTLELVKLMVSKMKYFTSKERIILLDVISSIEKYMEDIKTIETIQEFTHQLKILDDVYSKLKENNKTLNLDLTKYKKYYDKYIEPCVLMWSIGAISDMTRKTKTPSVEEFGEYIKNHLLPMLALQIIGAIATMIEQRTFYKAS